MAYETIKDELRKELTKRYDETTHRLKYGHVNEDKPTTKEERLNFFVRWDLNKKTSYKGDYETQLYKALETYKKRLHARLQKDFKHLEYISQAGELPNDLIITIEWKKSYMWGSNPRASTNYGFIGSSIGGCGYDKRSTATAEALNATPQILKLLYDAKESLLKENEGAAYDKANGLNREFLGYGSGYGIIPRFEGGVGVSCHQDILKRLGYNMRHLTNTDTTDVFLISKVNNG